MTLFKYINIFKTVVIFLKTLDTYVVVNILRFFVLQKFNKILLVDLLVDFDYVRS